MPYLSRRVAHLLNHLKSGKLVLSKEQHDQLAGDLAAVTFDNAGEPKIESVSSTLRTWARGYFLASVDDGQDPQRSADAAWRRQVVN